MATATEDEGSGGDMGWNPQATRTRSVLVCPPWMKAFGVSLITPQQDTSAPPPEGVITRTAAWAR